MDAFWKVSMVVWIVVLAVAAKGAWTAARRKTNTVRRGDPMRLAVFLVATIFIGHALRFLYAANSMELFKALYVVSTLTAVYVFRLMLTYGRGEVVA